MGTTSSESGTRIDEIADGIYRISTPVDALPGGFTFNQILIDDDEPLLFHTGLRALFPLVSEAVATVVPLERLRHVGYSHYEADECGSMSEWLEAAPAAAPLCGAISKMVNADDAFDRPATGLADGEVLKLGRHAVRWIDAPHTPHGWDCGFLFEETTRTLLCGDLFTQPGADHEPLTESDILGPSETLRGELDYYAHGRETLPLFEKLAATEPKTLACMHGASWTGDGAALLRELGGRVTAGPAAGE